MTITTSLLLAVYAVVNGEQAGWTSGQTLGLIGGAVALLLVFLAIEANVKAPLVPLGLFKLRNISVSNIVGVLWAAAMFAWFFLSALYMQLVLGYGPHAGRARLSAGQPDHGRLLLQPLGKAGEPLRHQAAAGRGPCLRREQDWRCSRWRRRRTGAFVLHVLPAMLLLGVGAGMAFNPVLLAAMSDVAPKRLGPGLGHRQHRLHDGRDRWALRCSQASRRSGLMACSHRARARPKR